ncbi:dienelactone hydrolase family protein [Roseiterribacter gracilis]|uniref:Carboxymethylenebutenolidase n=1 Tax=Roseiterribacter gracilis TaxID=2812848 RepID=A0A8S8XGY5_9PROT|nr:carboxymethylenebutenolidase [Rhodospirillales bacterium TMPK1]
MTKQTLTADDGHKFAAYRADPAGTARGTLVVLQEIFGVNAHIRRVCDGFAADGYIAIAPALFDRAERDVELGYDQAGFAKGRELVGAVGLDGAARDIGATIASCTGRIGVVGYCWGGGLAWLAAARFPNVHAAVGYYGRLIATNLLGEMPRAATILHYGEHDPHIPMSDVDKVRSAHPEMSIFTYDAGHGFNCEDRADFNPKAASLARARTLDFFRDKIG